MSPAGIAGEAEPGKEACLTGGGWGNAPYQGTRSPFTERLDHHPSPEQSCSSVKAATAGHTVLPSSQTRRETGLPEKPASHPASGAGLQRSGPGSKEGVQRRAASYSILLWAGTFWQDFKNSFIQQLTLSCTPLPKGHIHQPTR